MEENDRDENNSKAWDIAFKRSSEWFDIHADQRLKLFNFYILFFLGLLAGFAKAYEGKSYLFQIIISIVLLVITGSFKLLDRRTAGLVKDAEAALAKIEEKISVRLQVEEIQLVKKAANRPQCVYSYRQIFNGIFFLGGIVALAGLGVALVGMGAAVGAAMECYNLGKPTQ